MLSAIFQPEINTIESQIAQLQAQIALHQERITHLNEAETTADTAIAFLESALEKISVLSPAAITSLKTAVLDLFDSDNPPDADGGSSPNGNDGGNPTDPNPEPDLNGQYCEVDPDKYWRIAEPDGSAWGLASPIACLLSDAPTQQKPYAELVRLSDAIAYMKKFDGQVLACYIGFSNKNTAKSWGQYLAVSHSVASGFEVRQQKRLTNSKHELKLWGLDVEQIKDLARCNLSKMPPSDYGDAPKRQPIPATKSLQPARIEGLEPGDIVCCISVPVWEYRIIEIKNDVLDCERLGVEPSYRVALKPSEVSLVSRQQEREALDSIQLPLPDFNYRSDGRGYRDAARKNQMRNDAIANGWKPTKGTGLSTLEDFKRMEAQQKQLATVATDDSEMDF